jgi:hypothetical protein
MSRFTSKRLVLIQVFVLALNACTPMTVISSTRPTEPAPSWMLVPAVAQPELAPTNTPLPLAPTEEPQAIATAETNPDPSTADTYRCCIASTDTAEFILGSLGGDGLAPMVPKSHEKKDANPRYRGMYEYVDENAGYGVWLPSDWNPVEMGDGHQGMIFSPYSDDLTTGLMAEKFQLPYFVTQDDLPVLKENFENCIKALPGVEVESFTYTPTSTLITLEARFTYWEGDMQRKRWVREIYWDDGLLVFIAQGSSVEEFEYWLPMFYNMMTTFDV